MTEGGGSDSVAIRSLGNLKKKLGPIAWVADDRLSREKNRRLTTYINALRHLGTVDLLRSSIDESTLLSLIESRGYQWVFLPWYSYLEWNRLEASLKSPDHGDARLAGYFADQVPIDALPESLRRNRCMLLDLKTLSPLDLKKMIHSFSDPKLRTGLHAFIGDRTTLYTDEWLPSDPLGKLFDAFTAHLQQFEAWRGNSHVLYHCFIALWSLLYENLQSQDALIQASKTSSESLAHFEFANEENTLLLRLVFVKPLWKITELLEAFWPQTNRIHQSSQWFRQNADWMRVTQAKGSSEIELLLAFTPNREFPVLGSSLRTFWVETMTERNFNQEPEKIPNRQVPLRIVTETPSGLQEENKNLEAIKKKDLFIQAQNTQLQEYREEIAKQKQLLQELRMGGVGSAPPLPKPDPETLLDAFKNLYHIASQEISDIEEQLQQETELSSQERFRIEKRLDYLKQCEALWIQHLGEILKEFKKRRKASA